MPSASLVSVHPRVCGERIKVIGYGDIEDGSSPRVRGTPIPELPNCPFERFIPACAGNAPEEVQDATGHAVHPRVCGERINRNR